MKVMVDLNMVIDVVQERLPHYAASSAVLGKVLNKELSAVLPGHAITTIHYLVAKYATNKEAGDIVDWMLAHFEVAAVDKSVY